MLEFAWILPQRFGLRPWQENPSVQLALPVGGDLARGPGGGLLQRMVLWRDQLRSFERALRLKIPEPVLTWLEAADHRVAGRAGMSAGMLAGRRVAAADVPTARAAPQMKPPAVAGQALHTALATRRHARVDALIVGHDFELCPIVSPAVASTRRKTKHLSPRG